MIDLTGKKFGRLTVIKRVDNDKWGKLFWLCRCDCKNIIIVRGSYIKGGVTKSCGCLLKEGNNTKHGHTRNGKKTEFYQSWQALKNRCTNPNNKDYKNYGGRGITVCKEWREFSNFLKDMKKKWKPGLTLERRNNDKGYSPENCYWATWEEQQRNKRNNLCVPHRGEKRLLIELCEKYNIPRKIVWDRIYKLGWSVEEALITPVRKYRQKK